MKTKIGTLELEAMRKQGTIIISDMEDGNGIVVERKHAAELARVLQHFADTVALPADAKGEGK